MIEGLNLPHVHGFPFEVRRQLDTELAFISSYEPKIQQIKLAISRALNYSSGVPPINDLPLEVLAHIFHLARPRLCNLHQPSDDDYPEGYIPRYPDDLARGCNLWRKYAISSRSLWCHIDLSPYKPYCARLIARAEAHVARAGEAPIELHIADNETSDLECRDNRRISGRMGTLVFITTRREFGEFHRRVLWELLGDRTPIFTKLVFIQPYGVG
ncbi:hypothetical protein B0J17DRAFT_632237 [Rhizoctonia solani]|nr:hypothetical protein B0J17DRAFT_632237 [Rhizoctonia solani]